jgi:uncharacterized protein involved in exopolysaccharide biosynthesis
LRPKRSLLTIVGFVCGLLLAVLLAFFVAYIERLRSRRQSAASDAPPQSA